MDVINEVKKDYLIYIVIAIVCGVIAGFFLTFVLEMLIILSKVLIKYWWATLFGVAIILFIRRRKKK